MATPRYREEVLNVLLALLLSQRGIVTAPEQLLTDAAKARRHVPDVLVVYQGLRTVIEGKVADRPNARDRAFQDAQARVDKGIAHIALAVVYPPALRQGEFPHILEDMASSTLQVASYSEAGPTGWSDGGIDFLAELLRRTFDQLVKEDVVARAVEILSAGVNQFAAAAFATPAGTQEAAQILGIGEPPRKKRRNGEDEE